MTSSLQGGEEEIVTVLASGENGRMQESVGSTSSWPELLCWLSTLHVARESVWLGGSWVKLSS